MSFISKISKNIFFTNNNNLYAEVKRWVYNERVFISTNGNSRRRRLTEVTKEKWDIGGILVIISKSVQSLVVTEKCGGSSIGVPTPTHPLWLHQVTTSYRETDVPSPRSQNIKIITRPPLFVWLSRTGGNVNNTWQYHQIHQSPPVTGMYHAWLSPTLVQLVLSSVDTRTPENISQLKRLKKSSW